MVNNKTPNDIDLKMYSIDVARDIMKDTIGTDWDVEVSKDFFTLANKIYKFLVN